MLSCEIQHCHRNEPSSIIKHMQVCHKSSKDLHAVYHLDLLVPSAVFIMLEAVPGQRGNAVTTMCASVTAEAAEASWLAVIACSVRKATGLTLMPVKLLYHCLCIVSSSDLLIVAQASERIPLTQAGFLTSMVVTTWVGVRRSVL